MASLLYNTGLSELIDGTIDFLTDTIKVMYVTASYIPDQDDDLVDAGGADDPVDHEIVATGYTRGWGGAGRQTLGSKTITVDDANNRVVLDAADPAAQALGNGSNATIAGVLIIKEGGADDTTSRLLAYLDPSDVTTNGGNITLAFHADGLGYLGT